MRDLVYQNGAWIDPGAARVDVEDAGLLVGDGLFETLLVHDGRPVDPEAHLDRLVRGLAMLEIEIPESTEQLAEVLRRAAAEAERPHARLRITITRGADGGPPTRLVTAAECRRPGPEQLRDGVQLIVSALGVRAGDPLRSVKSTSYQRSVLAGREAAAAGAFEALLLNEHGRVAEGSRSNVMARFEDRVVTPPEAEGCLAGTVRRRLLEIGAVEEEPIPLERLLEADEILLSNSVVGVVPVGRLEGTTLEPGPAARTLRRHWEDRWLARS